MPINSGGAEKACRLQINGYGVRDLCALSTIDNSFFIVVIRRKLCHWKFGSTIHVVVLGWTRGSLGHENASFRITMSPKSLVHGLWNHCPVSAHWAYFPAVVQASSRELPMLHSSRMWEWDSVPRIWNGHPIRPSSHWGSVGDENVLSTYKFLKYLWDGEDII